MGFAIAVVVFLALCGALAWWGKRRRHGSTGADGYQGRGRDEAVAEHARHQNSATRGGYGGGMGGSPF